MNKPGSFKRVVNFHGWAIATVVAAGIAEVAVRVIPLIPKLL